MKVVIAEKIANAALKLFPAPEYELVAPEEFAANPAAALENADALIVRSAVQADEKLIANAKRLKVIGRAGVGVDNVDVEFATRRGIVVMNAPGASSVAVAELTIGLMLTMARHLSRADQTTRAGQWRRSRCKEPSCGKTSASSAWGGLAQRSPPAPRPSMKVVAADPYLPLAAHELGAILSTTSSTRLPTTIVSSRGYTATKEMLNAALSKR